MTKDARKNPIAETWTPEGLAVFLGCAPGIRTDNLKARLSEPAIEEIKAARSLMELRPVYDRKPNTRGQATTSIRFEIHFDM